MLSQRYGGFSAIVAHSFAAVATVMAVRDLGARTGALVTIAGVHDFEHVSEKFAERAGVTREVERRFRDRFARWAAPIMGDPWPRLLTELPADRQLPMLVIHDRDDREVDAHQAQRIVDANPEARLVLTDGLGHARILRDPAVVDAVREFVGSAALVPSA